MQFTLAASAYLLSDHLLAGDGRCLCAAATETALNDG